MIVSCGFPFECCFDGSERVLNASSYKGESGII